MLQGWYDDNLLAEAVMMYPELAALPRAGISYALWRNLFQLYIMTPSSPTTGWVGAPRPILYIFHTAATGDFFLFRDF